jgi:hypothetical protein
MIIVTMRDHTMWVDDIECRDGEDAWDAITHLIDFEHDQQLSKHSEIARTERDRFFPAAGHPRTPRSGSPSPQAQVERFSRIGNTP